MDDWKASELARHYVLAGHGDRALGALEHASPELADTWFWRANAVHQLSRCEEAIECAQRGLAIEPESSYLYQAVARAELMLGHFAEAEAAIRTALRSDPDEPEALATYASILSGRGERDAALKAVERAAELAPEMRSVRMVRAMLTDPWDDETAVRMSRELLEAEPEGAAEHWWHANNLVRRGRLRDAADHFARAAALEPANAVFTGAARMSRHWFFWPLRVTSPVLYWLAWYSLLPLWMYAASFGGVLWTALWAAIGWSSYALIYLLAYRYVTRLFR